MAVVYMRKLEEEPETYDSKFTALTKGTNLKVQDWILEHINKSEAIVDLLVLFLQANETINSDLKRTVASAVRWIGTSETVEQMSIPTSGYSMEASNQWHQTMNKWIVAMNGLSIFRGSLKGLEPEKVSPIAYDLSLLESARKKLAQRRAKN